MRRLLLVTLVIVCVVSTRGATNVKLQQQHAEVTSTPSSPYGSLTLVTEGFPWLENVYFDNKGAMYFSDLLGGKIFRVTRTNGTNVNGTSSFAVSEWVWGFERCLGFALSKNGDEMFAVANGGSLFSKESYTIIAFSLSTPQTFRIVATVPSSGNGLALHEATNVLYTTSEDDFATDKGAIYQMNMNGVPPINGSTSKNATVTYFAASLEAADGLWIDGDVMYMSEVLNGTIRMYNVSTDDNGGDKAFLGEYHAPNTTMVDDLSVTQRFCSSGVKMMFAADYWNGNIVAFPADGSQLFGDVMVTGLQNPTSVRPGRGPWFGAGRKLYITEGGSLLPWVTSRRLWELTLNGEWDC